MAGAVFGPSDRNADGGAAEPEWKLNAPEVVVGRTSVPWAALAQLERFGGTTKHLSGAPRHWDGGEREKGEAGLDGRALGRGSNRPPTYPPPPQRQKRIFCAERILS